MKRDVTETTAVCANVERVALSHPEIAFRLICDGQIRLETAGDGKLYSAIYAVFGRDFANRLIEVDGEYDGIAVKGYIGRSDNVKSNRNYESFYINKRYVKSRTAGAAIEQAFVSYMPSEKFPVCVLFISLSPGRVDVNVHPAKLEVKFSNEKPVFEAIYYAVRQALEQNTTRPEMEMPKTTTRMSDAFIPVEREKSLKARQITIDTPPVAETKKTTEPIVSVPKSSAWSQTSQKPAYVETAKPIQVTVNEAKPEIKAEVKAIPAPEAQVDMVKYTAEDYIKNYQCPVGAVHETESNVNPAEPEISEKAACEPQKIEDVPAKVEQTVINESPAAEAVTEAPVAEEKPQKIEYKIIGEAFNSYIIVQVEEKMLIIDKHAAHERIIFEQLKKNMYSHELTSQFLMLPIDVMLMSDEVAVIEEYRQELEAVGFEFSASRNTVSVTALPVGIEQDAVADMFAVVADRIKNGTGKVDLTKNLVFEKALYQASCKAAIKAGREYAKGHGEWVVEKLMEIPDITFCPHGRPVAMELSKKNIDRQFERT